MTATPDATDETSGIASSSSSCGTVDTFTAGEQTLDCTATDVAGNTTEVTVDYVGVSVTMLSTPTRAKFKAGSTIPAKFTLTGADGQPIAADLAAQLTVRAGPRSP